MMPVRSSVIGICILFKLSKWQAKLFEFVTLAITSLHAKFIQDLYKYHELLINSGAEKAQRTSQNISMQPDANAR